MGASCPKYKGYTGPHNPNPAAVPAVRDRRCSVASRQTFPGGGQGWFTFGLIRTELPIRWSSDIIYRRC